MGITRQAEKDNPKMSREIQLVRALFYNFACFTKTVPDLVKLVSNTVLAQGLI